MKQFNPGFRMTPGSSVNHPSVLNLSLHTKYTTPQDSRLLSSLSEEAQDMTPNSNFLTTCLSLPCGRGPNKKGRHKNEWVMKKMKERWGRNACMCIEA